MKEPTNGEGGFLSAYVGLFFLLSGVLFIAGCSFATEFVVDNKSDHPVEVRYRIRNTPGDLLLVCAKPIITAASNLDRREEKWQELSASQYLVDRENRMITISLQPEEALRITTIGRAKNKEQETSESEYFCADQLEIAGDYGEIRLRGPQVYMGFSAVSPELRTLTYQR